MSTGPMKSRINKLFAPLSPDPIDIALANLFATGCFLISTGQYVAGTKLVQQALKANRRQPDNLQKLLDFIKEEPEESFLAAAPCRDVLKLMFPSAI